VDLAGQVQGTVRPSKTLLLHRQIYVAACAYQGATRCIIHTHSTHCVAQSLRAQGPELLPPITPYFVMKVGHVPLLPYRRPGSPVAAEEVVDAIHRYGKQGTPLRAVMLPRLGPNVWHDTPEAAMAVLEELEETARLLILAPDTPPLAPEAIEELRQSFAASW
jgi:ribulose-5-phosphate 4-epimerase/fuculose-1-phosphate aldolase